MILVVVIGAGPAGLAAAVAAAGKGAEVLLIDENPFPGGQIWRKQVGPPPPKTAVRWIEKIKALDIMTLYGTSVIDVEPDRVWLKDDSGDLHSRSFDKLILATGARELFLPFPGWTIPNVMGCGGAQALLKSGLRLRGKKVIISGSGPLLLAVGASMASSGVDVALIAEQAPATSVTRFVLSLSVRPNKLWQAIRYRVQSRHTPYKMGTWVKSASGKDRLRSVVLTNGMREWEEPCDLLACGYGLVPNVELAAHLGCDLAGDHVKVDANQQTSIENVYCAGESAGIGGVEAALLEGEIAGLAATSDTMNLSFKISQRKKEENFLKRMEQAFSLREELKKLPRGDTIICRCEDVTSSNLKGLASQREAKLFTRCGMGPCQGRICGPACRFLYNWDLNRIRTPLAPLTVGAMRAYAKQEDYST